MSEIVDIVDKDDNVVGQNTRHESYRNKTTNRVVEVIIRNSSGKILLQRRHKSSSYKPLFWCSSASGHVGTGQTYLQAAQAELFEEIGVKCKLIELGKFYGERTKDDIMYVNDSLKRETQEHTYFCTVFTCIYDGSFFYDDGEVEETKYFSDSEIKELISSGDKVVPSAAHVLEKYII